MCHSVSPCAQPCPCHSHWRWWGATSRPAPEKPFSGCWRHSCGNTELQSRQEIRQEEAQGQRLRSRRHRSNLFMICLPMGVEPVKPSLRMSGWSDRRCPTMPPAGGDKWCVSLLFDRAVCCSWELRKSTALAVARWFSCARSFSLPAVDIQPTPNAPRIWSCVFDMHSFQLCDDSHRKVVVGTPPVKFIQKIQIEFSRN